MHKLSIRLQKGNIKLSTIYTFITVILSLMQSILAIKLLTQTSWLLCFGQKSKLFALKIYLMLPLTV